MGERKVLNKYLPPDFDPALVPRGKRPKDGMVSVRMMLPFSIQCSTCSTFLYRGRKFNSKKEPVDGPNGKYLGIQRFRFYIKCTACSRPVTFMTDPKNADYEMESGGTRNYEVYKDKEQTDEAVAIQKEEDEEIDPMRALENRVLDSQREMADLDNLEEIKAMNMKHVQLLFKSKASAGFGDESKALLTAREAKNHVVEDELNDNGLTETEEAIVKSIKFGQKPMDNGVAIYRLDEDDEKKFEENRNHEAQKLLQKSSGEIKGGATSKNAKTFVPIIKVKRRREPEGTVAKKIKTLVPSETAIAEKADDSGGGLGGLLGAYGSDSDSN